MMRAQADQGRTSMGGAGEAARLELRLDRADLDDEAADRLTRSLGRAIEEADLAGVRVDRVADDLPAGARGDAFTLGALALAVAPVLVEQVIQLVRDWSTRPNAKPVKVVVKAGDREISVEYDAARMTVEEIRALADKLRAGLEA
jgi:hypothetical protein